MTRRIFGGASTSRRRRNGLAWAYRHRAAHRNARDQRPYYFRVALGIVGFVSEADRRRGIRLFSKQGYNHFTCFMDVNATYALQYGHAAYHLPKGQVTVNW